MRILTLTIAVSAFAFSPAFANSEGVAEYEARTIAYQGHQSSSDIDFSAHNNAEGVAYYEELSQDAMMGLTRIEPAAGGGLSEEQLNNWELHRLQRFYNGDHGVTK